MTNIKEAVTWLGYTYLFVRMKKEHLHYGTSLEELASDPELLQKRRMLVTKAAKELEGSKMVCPPPLPPPSLLCKYEYCLHSHSIFPLATVPAVPARNTFPLLSEMSLFSFYMLSRGMQYVL